MPRVKTFNSLLTCLSRALKFLTRCALRQKHENVIGLPGAKHKHFQEIDRIKANGEADEVDADVRQQRRELLHEVLAGTFTAAQTWGYLTASGSAEPIASTHMDKHDDSSAPVIDGWRKHSGKERWVWVSPCDAAPTLHQVGVGGAIVSNIYRTSVPHLALAHFTPSDRVHAAACCNGHGSFFEYMLTTNRFHRHDHTRARNDGLGWNFLESCSSGNACWKG
jgi:hypothetical protein